MFVNLESNKYEGALLRVRIAIGIGRTHQVAIFLQFGRDKLFLKLAEYDPEKRANEERRTARDDGEDKFVNQNRHLHKGMTMSLGEYGEKRYVRVFPPSSAHL